MLTVNELSVTYPNGFTALHPTSVQFHRGEVTVLLGASGAGKSTLLRCLIGLATPTSGQVSTARQSNIAASAAALRVHRRRAGMIFQHHQLIQRRTVLQNTLMGRLAAHSTWRSLWPLPAADVRIALGCVERVGLLPHAMKRVDQLSGGQQQRVGIARALASRPELLLADEPVASLDPASADGVMKLVRDICKEDGLTAVVSLHQVELAKRVADRIVGLRGGMVVFDGSPASFSSRHADALYTHGAFVQSTSTDASNTGNAAMSHPASGT
ncbi:MULTISPECIES: phosphonate ABC transporter ATP-binding protein [unclassified Burkholderia]|uniref:phosphonate ABC transporter ATP-binding protein n=1 Tax=unclassified Burkholderia TaxID=2613784 RepID=UPI000F5863E6|nr:MULTISPECIES: phosphonate ABC transporter ATP-binding protein [unclassified Burkholderia]RQR40729.1 phosphonate ABC transporter ATP-binding protein [Burkholderia sp. Bp9142]RQR45397.1 phosphonate ABC transporter ATP-binding protein [Burkholderia sp. Bp9140]